MNAQIINDPSKALPENIDGWKILTDRTFNNETLYNYINGGAELFLSFGFTKVINRIYSRDNQPDLMIDIFYMNTSYDAFGVFSFSSGKIENNFGQQSQESNGAIIFWKNNFYVSIISNTETEESKKTIIKIAKLIEKSIAETGLLPEIIKYLPTEQLDKNSIRYFRHYVWLNAHFFISNENILNIDQNTQAVLSLYNEKDNKPVLLVIKYSNNRKAVDAKEKFIKNYNPKLKNSYILKDNKNKWIGIESVNNFFIGIFNSTVKESVNKLLSSTKAIIIKKEINK
jgi:hypothetical protein